jgi:hypothetical protein
VVRVVVVAQFLRREIVALLEGDCEFAHHPNRISPQIVLSHIVSESLQSKG